jgi:hypothetical protein
MSILKIVKANRGQAFMRLALAGPSGTGKTYDALKIAFGMVPDYNKICVIDSESKSAHLYSHFGPYSIIGLEAPYSLHQYIEAVKMAAENGFEVVIIDSLYHAWQGEGGALDMVNDITERAKSTNKFANGWRVVTPLHNKFVEMMLSYPGHVIGTLRTKMQYEVVEINGKKVPQKIGMGAICRDGLEYEFTTVFDLDANWYAQTSKDRTEIFAGKNIYMVDNAEKIGQEIEKWRRSGNPEADKDFKAEFMKIANTDANSLMNQMNPTQPIRNNSEVKTFSKIPPPSFNTELATTATSHIPSQPAVNTVQTPPATIQQPTVVVNNPLNMTQADAVAKILGLKSQYSLEAKQLIEDATAAIGWRTVPKLTEIPLADALTIIAFLNSKYENKPKEKPVEATQTFTEFK